MSSSLQKIAMDKEREMSLRCPEWQIKWKPVYSFMSHQVPAASNSAVFWLLLCVHHREQRPPFLLAGVTENAAAGTRMWYWLKSSKGISQFFSWKLTLLHLIQGSQPIDILGQVTLCLGGLSWALLASTHWLLVATALSPTVMTTDDVSRHGQMSQCSLGVGGRERDHPSWEPLI